MKTIKKHSRFLAGAIVAASLIFSATSGFAQTHSEKDTAIRPYHIKVSEAAVKELRQRILAARWPDKETVSDQSQG